MQRRIIVACIAYYEFDDSYLTDDQYNDLAKQLYLYQTKFDWEAEDTRYWYCLKDFDYSTGFNIVSKLNKEDKEWLTRIAKDVLFSYKKSKNMV